MFVTSLLSVAVASNVPGYESGVCFVTEGSEEELVQKNSYKIHSHEIDNPETVKKVLGLDANSLYLYAIAQNNPTDYFCHYKEEEDFRPDPCSKFGFQSYQWLSYVAYKENTFLQTRFNMGEKRVIFLPKAFHLTLFRGNHQNEAELKPN